MPPSDRVLQPDLASPPEQSADPLPDLLFREVEPLVRGTLDRRLRGAAGPREREELAGDVLVELFGRLRRRRISPGKLPEGLRMLVLAAAHRACDGFFRRRYPLRHRLKNRARYVLRHAPRFAVWMDANGATACGWARWKGRGVVEFAGCHVLMTPSENLESALEAVFEDAGGPVELDTAAGFLAAAWGARDMPPSVDSIDGNAVADWRHRIERFWTAIGLLPLSQRLAYLLHLRDDRGGPGLALLPASGVAGMKAIAESLELPVEELAEVWHGLPWGDAEIAGRLGLDRQQAIGLRCLASERLREIWRT